jgi:hypothetical protein
MSLIKTIVRSGILPLSSNKRAANQQLKTLRKLLAKAHDTAFGREYNFIDILNSDDLVKSYQEFVPVNNYLSIKKWWQRSFDGEKSVCWPGKTFYFALSSGTTDSASKYIPVSNDMRKRLTRASLKQIIHIGRSKNIPRNTLSKHSLMIGGSTDLQYNGTNYSGDLSGITTGNVPFWFEPFSKPDNETRKKRNWQEKIDEIVNEAPNWDVGMVAGVPAWVQIIFERIIEKYNLNTIHDLWPNLKVYIHGGVSLDPYKKSLEKLFGQKVYYYETYLASEGFIAQQTSDEAKGMKLLVKNGIFYEFIPFNEKNFTEDGELKENPEVVWLEDVRQGEEYALLISTCSGAWRYMIGDTIKFVSKRNLEIKITGRTKHFLSLCGEHLSVDNMNTAIVKLADELQQPINEFSVAGIRHEELFGHHWFISLNESVSVSKAHIKQRIDDLLKDLNDDYAVERKHALKDIKVDVYSSEVFLDFMRQRGKEGGQNKFPRVMKMELYEEWVKYLEQHAQTIS